MVVIGMHLFSDYLLPFELASILLLVALIGAIVLARRELAPEAVQVGQAFAEDSLELLEKPKEQLVASK
jgi:NAD(P)H-quinone oxidoreductase subunit 6